MRSRLTETQVQNYRRDGYLIVAEPIFPPETFAAIQKFSADKFAEYAEMRGGVAPQLIDCPHWHEPRMFEWLFSDAMLDLVEPLIGPDIALFACHLLWKPPSVGKRVPWHEDSAYWKGRLEPLIVASVTLALEPSTPENGCLQVLPGTHRHGYSDYEPVENPAEQVFHIEIKPEQRDDSKAVDIVLEPNQASIHDGKIIHGSAPNVGRLSRSALTVRYFPTHVKFNVEKNPNFQIYLARGRDRAGNPYSDPTKVYPRAGTLG